MNSYYLFDSTSRSEILKLTKSIFIKQANFQIRSKIDSQKSNLPNDNFDGIQKHNRYSFDAILIESHSWYQL